MKHDRIACPDCGGKVEISKVLASESQAELKLRRQARALEAWQQESEVAHKLDAERSQLTDRPRSQLDQEFSLKMREKEKQIDDLRKSLTDTKRKSEQGSHEGLGEALASASPSDLAGGAQRNTGHGLDSGGARWWVGGLRQPAVGGEEYQTLESCRSIS